jgi:hypothetical protein
MAKRVMYKGVLYDDLVELTTVNTFWEIYAYEVKNLPKYPNMLY